MDGFTATLESSAVSEALRRFPDTVLKYTKPASKISADSIAREAERRVRRDTGATAQGIRVHELTNGTGYVVVSTRRHMPNLPLWLEAGTQRGKPRSRTQAASPYFYPAVRLETSAHERRISEAVQQAIASEGLGG
jgi:hypothetical protein